MPIVWAKNAFLHIQVIKMPWFFQIFCHSKHTLEITWLLKQFVNGGLLYFHQSLITHSIRNEFHIKKWNQQNFMMIYAA